MSATVAGFAAATIVVGDASDFACLIIALQIINKNNCCFNLQLVEQRCIAGSIRCNKVTSIAAWVSGCHKNYFVGLSSLSHHFSVRCKTGRFDSMATHYDAGVKLRQATNTLKV